MKLRGIPLLLALIAFISSPLLADNLDFERARMKLILNTVAQEIEKNFYDPNLKGLDWKAEVAAARTRMDGAKSASDMLTAIFTLVNKLHDSHTVFLPPGRANRPLFGFEVKAFGDQIRVYELKRDGAAKKAGLQLGDQVLSINGFRLNRSNVDLAMRILRVLRPVPAMEIEISRNGGPPEKVHVDAKIKIGLIETDLSQNPNYFYNVIREAESAEKPIRYGNNGEVAYVQVPDFLRFEHKALANRLQGAKAVVVDLRNNPGGLVDGVADLAGFFEAQPLVMAQIITRKKTEDVKIKPHTPTLSGPMFILVDSESASAAEAFARHFQRTGRAVVVGDRSSGRLTAANLFPERVGQETVVFYGIEIAVGRFVFPDGKELEGVGVAPDHECLPSEEDLRSEHDNCLDVAYGLAKKALSTAPVAQTH